MNFKDGFALFKSLWVFIAKNIMLFLTIFLVTIGFWVISYVASSGYDNLVLNQNISATVVLSSLLMIFVPYFLFCIVGRNKNYKDKKYLVSTLKVPFRIQTYTYTLLYSLVLMIPIFLSLNVLSDDFVSSLENSYSQFGALEEKINNANPSELENLQTEVNIIFENFKEAIPIYNVAFSIATFLITLFLTSGMFMFAIPLMFSKENKGTFGNLKISIITFWKNIKGLFVYNSLVVIVSLLVVILNPFMMVSRIFEALVYCFIVFAMWFAYQEVIKNKSNTNTITDIT